MNEEWEQTLPAYLQLSIQEWKDGLENHSSMLDCLWGDLYGSINSARYDYVITDDEAWYLREKYLGLERV